jgi:hypothetical protein
MKYYYSITYHGEVTSTPEEDALEGIGQINDLVKDSFAPDLMAGVILRGMSVHVDQHVTTNTEGTFKNEATAKDA